MSVEAYLKELSAGQAYTQKFKLVAAMAAILEEYRAEARPADVYAHAVTFLGSCYKYRLFNLYNTRLRGDTMPPRQAQEKKEFRVSLPYTWGYDDRGRWGKQSKGYRPMSLAELHEELLAQFAWFAEKQPQKNMGTQVDLSLLQDLPVTAPDSMTNGRLLQILQTVTAFLLETVAAGPEDHKELREFLTFELSYEKQCQDDIQESDFKDPSAVIRQLLNGIRNYQSFLEKQAYRDDKNAAESLRSASMLSYGCYEIALKHFLYKWTMFLVEEGKKAPAELDAILKLKTNQGDILNYHHLLDRFNDIVQVLNDDPMLHSPEVTVDWKVLSKGWERNNRVKHVGIVPAAQELEQQIKEIIRFVKAIIPSAKDYPELARFLDEEETVEALEPEIVVKDLQFQEFSELCGEFDTNNYHYILVVPRDLRPESFGRVLAMPWDMIIDLDPASEKDGLMSLYPAAFDKPVTARTPGKVVEEFVPISAPYWIRGNGVYDEESSICDSYRQWGRRYGQYFNDIFRKFHSKYTSPVKVIYLPGQDEEFQADIIESVDQAFSNEDGTDTYGVEQILMDNHHLAEEFGLTSLHCSSLSLEQLLAGLAEMGSAIAEYQSRTFPGMKSNQQVENSLELEEFCEPVYLSLGTDPSDQATEVREFYRGARKISWRELALRKDLPRDGYQQHILPGLIRMIAESENPFFTIGYKPGHGGTTLLRRIAWDLHTQYPTLIMRRYFPSCAARLQALRSQIPNVGRLVLLIDSNDMSAADADRLFTDLRINTVPAAIIYLKRRERPSGKESFSLGPLNQDEITQMIDRLLGVGVEDACRMKLERQRTMLIRNEAERTPFCLAMYAFDKDFAGFKSYVSNFLNEPMQDIYREFLVYIALSNRINDGPGLDAEFFAYHMDGVRTGNEAMQKLCQRDAFSNLVVFQKRDKVTFCKMRYAGIAEEVLIQMTNRTEDAKAVNYSILAQHIRSLIKAASGIPGNNDNLEDFFKRLLIERDTGDYEDRESFAGTILDICHEGGNDRNWSEGGIESARSVLNTLADAYPHNPHFAAHYGRFISERLGRYEEALEVLDRAISMDSDSTDCSLLHMKGTVYFRMVEQAIDGVLRRANNPNADLTEDFRLLYMLFDEAQELFERVRTYGSSGVTGMLSNIRLCINVITMGKRLEKVDTEIFFQRHHEKHDRYRVLLDRANNLFEECENYLDSMSAADMQNYNNIQNEIRPINMSSRDCIAFYENKITDPNLGDRSMLRRHLARIYENDTRLEQLDPDSAQRTDAYRRIMQLMTENILEDPSNTANYRQWFRAALNSRCPDEELQNEAVIYVNQWLDQDPHDCQAYLYRYMLTFLMAYDGDTSAENRLELYRREMQSASRHIVRNTDTKFILTHGSGLQRLSARLFNMKDAEEAQKNLLPVIGRLANKKSRNGAIIRSYGADVFFNPMHTNGAIRDEHFQSEAQVSFGLLFSYDGPRAHDTTVQLHTGRQDTLPLGAGRTVRCSVLQRVNDHLVLSIQGYTDRAKLPLKELAEPYSEENIPAVMTDLDVVVRYRTEITYRGEVEWGWFVTMHSDAGEAGDIYRPLAENEILKALMEKMK